MLDSVPLAAIRAARTRTHESAGMRRVSDYRAGIEVEGLAAVGRHKGSRTPSPRTNQPCRGARAGAGTIVAYRGSNGPSLLTKQAQHSTSQYYP